MSSELPPVNNLVDLVTRLRGANFESNEIAFNTLQELVGNDTRIRYEIVDRTPDESPLLPREGRFSHLNGLTIKRVLLTSNRLKSDFTRELTRECNGVALEYPGWKVLSVPSPMVNPCFRANEVINNLDSYSIYEIKDGTTVTMYWFDGKWCLSSTNGFDVSGYRWIGQSTYAQALSQVTKLYPDFSFDKLDRERAYTIGFRHNEFHPLLSDPAKMWLIQSCDLAALNAENPSLVISNSNIGIPLQTASAFDVSGRELFKLMQAKNDDALSRYLKTRDSKSQQEIHYGYVLRSNSLTGAAAANSNIILESTLLKRIRFLMYNLPKQRFAEATAVTATNRLEYTILRAYLSCSTKYVFLALFPQFSKQYRDYDILFGKLSNKIITALRSRNARAAIMDAAREGSDINNRADKLAYALVKHIESCGKINAMDPQGPNIVLDFIMDKKHLDLYYTCMFSQ